MKVGRSVHSVNEARQAELDGADYVIAGTIFPSPSHPGVVPGGTELLRNITPRLGIPVIAIGGITTDNIADCWSAGAERVAVISSLLRAENPRLVAERLAPPPPED